MNLEELRVFARRLDETAETLVTEATRGKQGVDKRALYLVVYPLAFRMCRRIRRSKT